MAKVILVIPHDRFNDDELKTSLSTLKQAGHEISIGSTHHTEAQGHGGFLVKPDVNIQFVEPSDYDAFVFIGGLGVEEFLLESSMFNLIRKAYYERKIIGAIGMAVELLIYAGVVAGKKITSDNATLPKVQAAGAYYSGRLVEVDERIITGAGAESSQEFATKLAAMLKS